MITGFINVWKPPQGSSAKLVSSVKKITGEQTGHMGTLDPMAEGVLPVCVGRAGRLFDYLLDKKKVYVAEFAFGKETDTLDVTGQVIKTTDVVPTVEQIQKVLPSLTGDVMQVPPNYSAKSVGGVRGYQLARQGKEFTLPPKKVTIDEIELLEQTGEAVYRFRITAGGGTYVRSIGRDIGYACGSLGTMTSLVREQSGPFVRENACTVEQLSIGDWKSRLIPADTVVSFPKVHLDADGAHRLLCGLPHLVDKADGLYRVYAPNEFFGIGVVQEGKMKMKSYLRTEIYADI